MTILAAGFDRSNKKMAKMNNMNRYVLEFRVFSTDYPSLFSIKKLTEKEPEVTL